MYYIFYQSEQSSDMKKSTYLSSPHIFTPYKSASPASEV